MCGGIGGKVDMMRIQTRGKTCKLKKIDLKLRWASQVSVYDLNGKTTYIRDRADDDSAPE
jgi:hypothetical protein